MKYKLTDNIIRHNGKRLYQIEALEDFASIRKGDLGGFVQSECNLSHHGSCWIYDEAIVRDTAKVCDDAIVSGSSVVRDNASINKNAVVDKYAIISENACISDRAVVTGYTEIKGDDLVSGNSWLDKEVLK